MTGKTTAKAGKELFRVFMVSPHSDENDRPNRTIELMAKDREAARRMAERQADDIANTNQDEIDKAQRKLDEATDADDKDQVAAAKANLDAVTAQFSPLDLEPYVVKNIESLSEE
jgi:hypothetical protein